MDVLFVKHKENMHQVSRATSKIGGAYYFERFSSKVSWIRLVYPASQVAKCILSFQGTLQRMDIL